MVHDVLRYHRDHFLEHLAAVLHELHVAAVFHAVGARAAQKAVVVADVVGKAGGAAGGFDREIGACCVFFPFQQGGGGHVAKDKVAVAVAPFDVGRTNFGVDHQRRADRSGTDHVGGGLNAKSGGRAGDVHVESKALNAQQVLNFNGDGGVGALKIRGGADNSTHVGGGFACVIQCDVRGLDRHFGHDRRLVIAALTHFGVHHGGVQNAIFDHHVTLFDARCLEDEIFGRVVLGLDRACGDPVGMFGIVQIGIGVEGRHQFCVRDRLGGCEDTCACDRRCVHDLPLFSAIYIKPC